MSLVSILHYIWLALNLKLLKIFQIHRLYGPSQLLLDHGHAPIHMEGLSCDIRGFVTG